MYRRPTMDDRQKDSYLHLMYRAFVEIRNISISAFVWYNPKTWGRNRLSLRRINRLANVMHNLPFDLKTSNINEFDEESFWKTMARFEEEFYADDVKSYENLFDKLEHGEKRKIVD
jgi:hypothetical protein